jgi:hypothetical protein
MCQADRVIRATPSPAAGRPRGAGADKTGGGATGRVGIASRCYEGSVMAMT